MVGNRIRLHRALHTNMKTSYTVQDEKTLEKSVRAGFMGVCDLCKRTGFHA